MRAWRLGGLLVLIAWTSSPSVALAQSALDREAGPAAWRTAHAIYGASIATAQGSTPEHAAIDVLRRLGAELGLDTRDSLRVTRVMRSHGYVVVEFARVLHDLPVLGAPIVVRVTPDHAIDLIDVAPMPTSRGPWPNAVRTQEAVDVAAAAAPFPSAHPLDTELVALVHQERVVAAIAVELAGARPIDRARAYVDATSLELLWLEERALDALGRVFLHNPATDMAMTSDLPLGDLTSTTNLVGAHLRVASCDQLTPDCNTVTRAIADASGDFLFTPDARAFDDAFSEVSAYFHGSLVVDYFHTAHAFTWTCTGTNVMDVIVNYSEAVHVGYDNAMFIPGSRSTCGSLVFGQGAIHDYAYDGDVVYHEYGHAVTDQISALGFFATGPADNYQPLAINEGTSDYWAAAVDGDPQIGESIGSYEGFMGSLRGIADVVVCPNDLLGEGHSDGRIWSTFGWALRGIVGQTRADALWFTTMSSLSGGVTLAQATNTLLATVMTEVRSGSITSAEQAMIMAAATARGLPDCTMFVPIDDGHLRTGYSGNAFVTGGLSHGLAPIEYTLQIPPDVTDVEIEIGHPTIAGMVTVHFMNDVPVRGTGARIISQLAAPVGRIGTAFFTRTQGLVPCSTLYIGIETSDIRTGGESIYSIFSRVNTTHETRACPPRYPDAGPVHVDAGQDAGIDDAGSDGSMAPAAASGCGCGVGASRGGAAYLALALLLVVSRRARRRGADTTPVEITRRRRSRFGAT